MKKKNVFLLLVALLCMTMLTGCIRFSTTIEVKKNGKANVSILMAAVDTDMEGGDSSSDDSDEDRKKLEAQGWKYEEYKEDGYNGYIITKKNVDLKELADSMNGESDIDMNSDKLVVNKKGSKYSISWDISSSESMEEGYDYSSYFTASGGYAKFIIKLPVKPISSNAHEVSEDGKTLTWNLFDIKPGEKIEVEFRLINWPLIICLTLVALLVICFIILFILISRQKSNQKAYQPGPQYGYPGGPQYGQAPQQPYQAAQQQPYQQQAQQPYQQPYQAAPQQPYTNTQQLYQAQQQPYQAASQQQAQPYQAQPQQQAQPYQQAPQQPYQQPYQAQPQQQAQPYQQAPQQPYQQSYQAQPQQQAQPYQQPYQAPQPEQPYTDPTQQQ